MQSLLSLISYKYHLYTWRILRVFKGQSLHSFKLVDGSRFDYPFYTAVGASLFMNKFETAEIDFIRQTLKPGNTFIDIGANAGLYTVIAAKIVGSTGHVYAFEPGTRELELLRRNIEINNLSNVTIIERAVSNCKSIAKFAISKDGAMNSLFKTDHPGQIIEEWKDVETTTIDDFIQEFDITRIDFIKIDVEGAEKLVFEGAKNLLSSNSQHNPIFLFEASDLTAGNLGCSVKTFLEDLESSGVNVYVIDEDLNIIEVNRYKSQEKIGNQIYIFLGKK